MKRVNLEFLAKGLSDDKPKAEYVCPSCHQVGFSFDVTNKLGIRFDELEYCRVCGLLSLNSGRTESSKKKIKRWNQSWIECGAKVFSELTLDERVNYYNEIYDVDYRKQYFILSEEDRLNHRLDSRLFTDNGIKLPFIVDDKSEVVVQSDSGEKWVFTYETNKILYLDDKRYIMVLAYANVILGSEQLAGFPSVRYNFPGLTPDLFTFVGVLKPTCRLQDLDGEHYEVRVVNKNA